jgi:hypothetical protein
LTAGKGFGLKALAAEMNLTPEETRKLLSGKSEEVMAKLREAGADPEKPLINSQKDLTSATKDLTNALMASRDPTDQYRIQMRRSLDDAVDRANNRDKESFSRFQYLTNAMDTMIPRSKEEGQRGMMKFFDQYAQMDPFAAYALLQVQQQLLNQLDAKLDNRFVSTAATTKSSQEAIQNAGIAGPNVSQEALDKAIRAQGGDPEKINKPPMDDGNPFNALSTSTGTGRMPVTFVINAHGKGTIAKLAAEIVSGEL